MFGVLKQRFRVLKFGTCIEDDAKQEMLMRTCAALHNLITRFKSQTGEFASLASETDLLHPEDVGDGDVPTTIYERSIGNRKGRGLQRVRGQDSGYFGAFLCQTSKWFREVAIAETATWRVLIG